MGKPSTLSENEKESLSSIGWKEEWLHLESLAADQPICRLECPHLLTVSTVLILATLFKSRPRALSFLKLLLPQGCCLPDVKKFNRLVCKAVEEKSKLKKAPKSRRKKTGEDQNEGDQPKSFLECSFFQHFKLKTDPSSVSGPCPPTQNELDKLQIETLEKNLKEQKLEFDSQKLEFDS